MWIFALRFGALLLVGLLSTGSLRAADPTPGSADYLGGLEALAEGNFKSALNEFGKAVEADEANADYHTARGVAFALTEQFPTAIRELERSLRLRPGQHEPRIWLAAAYRMSGEPAKGTQHFTLAGDLPQDYSSFLYNDLAMDYWQAVVLLRPTGKTGREGFAKAGLWFAKLARERGGPALSAAWLARAKQLYDQQQYAAARAAAATLLERQPDDPEALGLHAWCLLLTGDLEASRAEFTRVLTLQTRRTDAYLGRAAAAAQMSDFDRATADLEIAKGLSPETTNAFRESWKRYFDTTNSVPPGVDLPSRVDKLIEAARDPQAQWKWVVDEAIAVRRILHSRRRRLDEQYQNQLRIYEAQLAAAPRNPARIAELAAFLQREANVLREQVEPHSEAFPFRRQTPTQQTAELDRSQKLCAEALAIDPKQPLALSTSAALAMWRLDYTAARPHLQQLGASNDPQVALQVLQLLEADAARRRLARARRQPDPWSDWQTQAWRQPSQAELDRTDELDQAADPLVQQAQAYLEQVAQRQANTAIGALCRSYAARQAGQRGEALKQLELAVKLQPDLVEGWLHLANLQQTQGNTEAALTARMTALNLCETTAAPRLRQAWQDILATRWKSARAALTQARQVDPADYRWAGYLAALCVADERPEEAGQWYRVALALDEARAILSGTTFQGAGPAVRAADDFGPGLELRLKLARIWLAQNEPALAEPLLRSNLAVCSRVSNTELPRQLVTALFPDPINEPHAVPAAPSLAALLGWSHLELGRALVKKGDVTQATEQFAAAVKLPEKMARTTAIPGVSVVQAWGGIELCRLALDRNDLDAARTALGQAASQPDIATKQAFRELRERVNRVARQRGVATIEDDSPPVAAPAQTVTRSADLIGAWQTTGFSRQRRDRATYTFLANGQYTCVTLDAQRLATTVTGTYTLQDGKLYLKSAKGPVETYEVEVLQRDLLNIKSGEQVARWVRDQQQ